MLWGLWAVGLVVAIIYGQVVRILIKRGFDLGKPPFSTPMNIIAIICIIIVGGMQCGAWFAYFVSGFTKITAISILDFLLFLLFGVTLPMLLTFGVGYFVMRLDKSCPYIKSHMIFAVVFVVSTMCWAIPMQTYYNNFENYTETISSTEERQILYFCNIPVQNVSGNVSGSSSIFGGNVEGSISTTEFLPYWYLGSDNEFLYDSAPAANSSITFIAKGETPYLEIVSHQKLQVVINHNNNVKKTMNDGETTKEYIFHLPEEVMQYRLNE